LILSLSPRQAWGGQFRFVLCSGWPSVSSRLSTGVNLWIMGAPMLAVDFGDADVFPGGAAAWRASVRGPAAPTPLRPPPNPAKAARSVGAAAGRPHRVGRPHRPAPRCRQSYRRAVLADRSRFEHICGQRRTSGQPSPTGWQALRGTSRHYLRRRKPLMPWQAHRLTCMACKMSGVRIPLAPQVFPGQDPILSPLRQPSRSSDRHPTVVLGGIIEHRVPSPDRRWHAGHRRSQASLNKC
jgi:hypothetical protein